MQTAMSESLFMSPIVMATIRLCKQQSADEHREILGVVDSLVKGRRVPANISAYSLDTILLLADGAIDQIPPGAERTKKMAQIAILRRDRIAIINKYRMRF